MIIVNEEIHLELMAKEGVGMAYFNQIAWEITRSNNIASKIDMETMS